MNDFLYNDGDNYPVLRIPMIDEDTDGTPVPRDLTNAAVEFQILDENGAVIVTRPGRILTPKSDGFVECFFAGRETDFSGSGGARFLVPVLWIPTKDGLPATNLLSNSGFDTYSGTTPTRFADDWSLVGAQTSEQFDCQATGPKPPIVFEGGYYQEVAAGATPATYLEQQYVPSPSIGAGAYVSFGCWVRSSIQGYDPQVASDDWSIGMAFTNAADDTYTQCAAPESNWRFVRVERRLENDTSILKARLRYLGQPNAIARYDDSCMFVGRYGKLYAETQRIRVLPRVRPLKTVDMLAGYGGFEADSNTDDIPDGWIVSAAGTHDASGYHVGSVTYKIDDSDLGDEELYSGEKSLRISGTGGAGQMLVHIEPGNFPTGDTWRFSAMIKSDAVTTPGAMQIVAVPWQDTGIQQQTAETAMPGASLDWTEYHVDLSLTGTVDSIECRFALNAMVSATYWIDEVKLYRVSP